MSGEMKFITSSGDAIVDRLLTFLIHSHADVTAEMACHIATNMCGELFGDDAIEFWGIKLSAEIGP